LRTSFVVAGTTAALWVSKILGHCNAQLLYLHLSGEDPNRCSGTAGVAGGRGGFRASASLRCTPPVSPCCCGGGARVTRAWADVGPQSLALLWQQLPGLQLPWNWSTRESRRSPMHLEFSRRENLRLFGTKHWFGRTRLPYGPASGTPSPSLSARTTVLQGRYQGRVLSTHIGLQSCTASM
jgi:hypothetical protein